MRKFQRASILIFALAGSCLLMAADHKEAPIVQENQPADIADLYAFLNPNDPSLMVLALTVNPFSVPAEAFAYNFSPRTRYRFQIDNNGDAIPDHFIVVTFKADQTYRVQFSGPAAGERIELSGTATLPTEEAEANPVVIASDDDRNIKVFAGPRDDPFFFDVVGFSRTLSGSGGFTGSDGFAGFNVSAVVVEFPHALVNDDGGSLNIWATSEENYIPFKNGHKTGSRFFRQIDRMGNPAVNTALLPSNLKDRYNVVRPTSDAEEFAPAIVASLQALGTNDENIGILASVAVPDVLTIDVNNPTAFPNGRGLADDVIDTLFFFIFNQMPVADGVDANDAAFSSNFPYLAGPWQP